MQFISSILGAVVFATSVQAAVWVAGYQSSGYNTGWIINQYSNLFVGNPRTVAWLGGSGANTQVGAICNGSWTSWHISGNPDPGHYDFNCIHSIQDINKNAANRGYEIGGINHNGVTVADCYIDYEPDELCDSDTISDAGNLACTVWVVCE